MSIAVPLEPSRLILESRPTTQVEAALAEVGEAVREATVQLGGDDEHVRRLAADMELAEFAELYEKLSDVVAEPQAARLVLVRMARWLAVLDAATRGEMRRGALEKDRLFQKARRLTAP